MLLNMDYHTMDDEQLWSFLLKGDTKALKETYYRHYDLLFNYGVKFCGNEELVKDCIHDLFLRIFGNKKLSHVTSIASYLLKSIKNLLLEKLSKQENFVHLEFASDPEILLMDLPPDEFYNDDETLDLSQRLLSAYSSLSEKQRQIIYLRFVREMSFKEIASFLEINTQSAMNLAFRSLSKLREILTKNKTKKE